MASNAALAIPPVSAPAEEIQVDKNGVSLCLLLNRRAKTLRVIDFRSGPSPAKRATVETMARREGVQRVYTLVERDEASAWVRLGFQREGTIPGFYKRSDAYVLGAYLPSPEFEDAESGVHRVIPAPIPNPENVYQNGKKLQKKLAEQGSKPSVKVQELSELELRKAMTGAERTGRLLSSFEAFSRDVRRWHFSCNGRRGDTLIASVETQPCFDNALLELLAAPADEKGILFATAAVEKLCEELNKRGIVGCFALSPATDVGLAAVYASNGFRRTGLLQQHIVFQGRRVDAFLWTRKLAQPADD